MCDGLTVSEVHGVSQMRRSTASPSRGPSGRRKAHQNPPWYGGLPHLRDSPTGPESLCVVEVRKIYCDPNTVELHRAKKTRAHSAAGPPGVLSGDWFAWSRRERAICVDSQTIGPCPSSSGGPENRMCKDTR